MALNEWCDKSINGKHSCTQPHHTCHQMDPSGNLLQFYQLSLTSHSENWAMHHPVQSESLSFMGLLNFARGTDRTAQGESHLIPPLRGEPRPDPGLG